MTTTIQQRVTKTQVKEAFNELRNYNFRVIHFSYRGALPKSIKDFPDIVIIGRGYIYFVEVKLGRDRLSEGQEEMGKEILRVAWLNKTIFYDIVTENNYLTIRDAILQTNFNRS